MLHSVKNSMMLMLRLDDALLEHAGEEAAPDPALLIQRALGHVVQEGHVR